MNNHCNEESDCTGGKLTAENGNVYCDKHFVSEHAYNLILAAQEGK